MYNTYFAESKKREILKQIKNTFRYEPQKELSLDACLLESEEGGQNVRVIKYYCIEIGKKEEMIIKNLLLGKYIFLILRQFFIEVRRIIRKETISDFLQKDKDDLEACYDCNNEDRMQCLNMELFSLKEAYQGKKKINRTNWYVGIVEDKELNNDETFVERDTQFVLEYQGIDYKGIELVKPQNDRTTYHSKKRCYSLKDIFDRIDSKKIPKNSNELEASYDSESEEGKFGSTELEISMKKCAITNSIDYPTILPNSIEFKNKVLDILQGTQSENKTREENAQFMIKSVTTIINSILNEN